MASKPASEPSSNSIPGLPPAVLLTGPTAAGKTAAALMLADELPVALINVDSAQVYRGLDIGSAKPDPATLARYPHALIDIRDPEQAYSAAEFASDCEAVMRQAWDQQRLPVLVGGTWLYLRAMLYGLDEMPAADPALRLRIAAEGESRGWEALHAELAERDPAAASRIAPADRQRIQRALELIRLTGRGPSEFQRRNRLPRMATLRLVLTSGDRAVLHRRIDQRFRAMLDQGLIEEVQTLEGRPGLTAAHPSMRSVGYRQVWQYLNGELDHARLVEAGVAATRQLAKRQLTALRQLYGALWYDPDRPSTMKSLRMRVARFHEMQTHTG